MKSNYMKVTTKKVKVATSEKRELKVRKHEARNLYFRSNRTS